MDNTVYPISNPLKLHFQLQNIKPCDFFTKQFPILWLFNLILIHTDAQILTMMLSLFSFIYDIIVLSTIYCRFSIEEGGMGVIGSYM